MTRSRDVPARIIDAAIEILATDRSVSMPLREVAARAGVTTGAIQHHFGDKQGLVLAALQQHGQRFADRLRARRGDHTPAPGAVRSEEHTSELQSRGHLVCRLLLQKKKTT